MEAARLPMISFDLKTSPEKTEFTSALLKFIGEQYDDNPASYAKQCAELDQLRQNACNVGRDFVGCNLLKRYFSQLCFLVNRFPALAEDGHSLEFTWDDAYLGNSCTHGEIQFEQACTMYNIGCLHSILGAMDSRVSPEGMKVSCTHFQCAAGAFQFVKDSYQESSCHPDFAHDTLQFHIDTLLGQAQECILEKSMADNRKHTITAKVAVQCMEFYKKALPYLESDGASQVFGSSQAKLWRKHLELKVKYLRCITFYFMGLDAESQQQYGEAVTYTQAAMENINECSKLAKALGDEVASAVQFVYDVAVGKCASAKKDNDFVYHKRVPTLESLPEIKGVILVKGIGFDPADKEVSGPDIFAKLVPMEAHELASLYSEEKAKLMRGISADVETKNEELAQYMTSLHLDPDNLVPEHEILPEALVEKCAAISVKPVAVKELTSAMQELSGMAIDVESALAEMKEQLLNEKELDKSFQDKHGSALQEQLPTDDIEREAARYEEALAKARQSNNELSRVMAEHVRNLKLLALPLSELKATLPSAKASIDEADMKVIDEMKRLLSKVTEMQTQRASLYDELRTNILNDDVTKILATKSKDGFNSQEFFQSQLKKHDSLSTILQQNISAQDKILKAVTDCNARLVPVRQKIEAVLAERDGAVQSMVYSHDVYNDLLEKSSKGMEFYRKLLGVVDKLRAKVDGLCKARAEQREKHEARLKASALDRGTQPDKSAMPTRTAPDGRSSFAAMTKGMSDSDVLKMAARMASDDDPAVRPVRVQQPEVMLDTVDDGRPKLKDFLPFMKKSWQKDGSALGESSSDTPIATAGSPFTAALLPAAGSSFNHAGTAFPRDDGFSTSLSQGLPTAPAAWSGLGPMVGNRPPATLQLAAPTGNPHPVVAEAAAAGHAGTPPMPNYVRQPWGQQQQQQGGTAGANVAATSWSQVPAPGALHGQLPLGQRGQLPHQHLQHGLPVDAVAANVSSVSGLTGVNVSSSHTITGTPVLFDLNSRQQPQLAGDSGPLGMGPAPLHNHVYPQSSQQQPLQQGMAALPSHRQPGTQLPSHGGTGGIGMEQQQQWSQQASLPAALQTAGGSPFVTAAGRPREMMQPPTEQKWSSVPPGSMPPASGASAWQQPLGIVQQHHLSPAPVTGQQQQQQQLPQQYVPQLPYLSEPSAAAGQQQHRVEQQQHRGEQQQLPTVPGQLPSQPALQGPAVPGMQPQLLQQHWPPAGLLPQLHQLFVTGEQPQQQQPTYVSAHLPHVQPSGQQLPQPSLMPNPSQTVPALAQRPQHGQLPMSGHAVQSYLPPGSSALAMGPTGQQLATAGPNSDQAVQHQLALQPQPYPSHSSQQPAVQPRQDLQQQPLQSPLPGQLQSFAEPQWQLVGQQQPHGYQQPHGQQQLAMQPHGRQLPVQASPSPGLHPVQQQLPLQHAQQSGQQAALLQGSQRLLGQQPLQSQQPSQQQVPPLPHSQQPVVPQQPSQVWPSSQQQELVNQRSLQSLPPGQQPPGQHQFPQSQLPGLQQQQQSGGQPRLPQPEQLPPPQQQQPPVQQHFQPGGQPQVLQPQRPGPQPSLPPQQPGQSLLQPPQQSGHQQMNQPSPYPGQQQTWHHQQPGPQQALPPRASEQQQQQLLQPQPPGQQLLHHAQLHAQQQHPMSSALQTLGQTMSQPQQPEQQLHLTSASQPPLQPQSAARWPQQQPQLSRQQQQTELSPFGQQQPAGPVPGQQPHYELFAATPGHVTMVTEGAMHGLQEPITPQQPFGSHMQPYRPSTPAEAAAQQPCGAASARLPACQPAELTHQQPSASQTMAAIGNASDTSHQTLQLQIDQPTVVGLLPSPAQRLDATEDGQLATIAASGLPLASRQDPSSASSVDWSQANVSSKLSPGGRSKDSKSSTDEAKKSKTKAVNDTASHLTSSDDAAVKKQAAKELQRDPYSTDEALDRFVNDVERYEKVVASLCKPSLSGPTPLEKEWKELADEQERQSRKLFMAVGLSESMRNRCPDMIPYDKWRVVLTGQKNDYINASLIENLPAPAPNVLATQGPLPQTVQDFWTMIFQQDCEVIAMLSKYDDQDQSETIRYWPKDRQDSLTFGDYQVSLHLMNTHKHWVERRLIITALKTRQTKAVTQLQYTAAWPSPSPGSAAQQSNPQPLFMFANEVHSFHRQQRNGAKPVVVHCSNGTTKTGTFLVLYCGMLHISTGQGIGADLIPHTVNLLRARRKWCVTSKEDLLFCYTAILYYAEDLLMKRGILTNKASFGNPLPSPGGGSHVRKPSDDFRSAKSLADLNQSVEKMLGKKGPSQTQQPPPDGCNGTVMATATAVSRKAEGAAETHAPSAATMPASASGPGLASGERMPPSAASAASSMSAMPASIPVAATSSSSNGKVPSTYINSAGASANLDSHGAVPLRGQAEQQGVGGGCQSATPLPAAAAAGGGGPPQLPALNELQLPPVPLQSLLDIQNPETFNLGATGVKKRITKADFLVPQSKLTDSAQPSDASDPLASLDPLWSFAVK